MALATLSRNSPATGQKAESQKGVLADALRIFARRRRFARGSRSPCSPNFDRRGEQDQRRAERSPPRSPISSTPWSPPTPVDVERPPPRSRRAVRGRGGKTRISVINLSGSAATRAKQAFVNRLQMALFTWIKQNPSPTGRLYVLDEAQNFAPSVSRAACKRERGFAGRAGAQIWARHDFRNPAAEGDRQRDRLELRRRISMAA